MSILGGSLTSLPVLAQAAFEPIIHIPDTGAVAISGDYALVGNKVFKRSGSWWAEQATLTPDDGDSIHAPTGHYVDLAGSYALLGTTGKAYIFARQGAAWIQQATLTPPDGDEGGSFGFEVAISEDFAFVGAPYRTEDNRVYVFQRDGERWLPSGVLRPDDRGGFVNDGFGMGIAVSGNTLIIGANGSDRAYIFTYNGVAWTQEAMLQPEGVDVHQGFGVAVNISGNTAIIGGDDHRRPDGSGWGIAYIFAREGARWVQQAELSPGEGEHANLFGHSVGISGAYAVVGADGSDAGGDIGAAYVFHQEGGHWQQYQHFTDDTPSAKFGFSVESDGRSILVNGRESGTSFYSLAVAWYVFAGRVTDAQGVGLAGVALQGLPGNPVTDADGNYQAQVPDGWFGTVVPTKVGYRFESRVYAPVTANLDHEDSVGIKATNRFSGQVRLDDGTPVDAVRVCAFAGDIYVGNLELHVCAETDAAGRYALEIPHGLRDVWIQAALPGVTVMGNTLSEGLYYWEPITAPRDNQDLVIPAVKLSGTVWGAKQTGLPGIAVRLHTSENPGDILGMLETFSVRTNAAGEYAFFVRPGWSGIVTPDMGNFPPEPAQRSYQSVTGHLLNQGFVAWLTPVSVHSANDARFAARAIDRDVATAWTPGVWKVQEYRVILDLGATYEVDQLRFWHRQWNSEAAITAMYLADTPHPQRWGTSIGHSPIFPDRESSGWKTVDVTRKAGRYLKLVSAPTNSLYWREIQVLPALTPPAAPSALRVRSHAAADRFDRPIPGGNRPAFPEF
jgi:FG-GAP repeat